MILASFDFESTGVDLREDRIIEVGLALYSTGRERVLEQTSFLVEPVDKKVTDEIAGITRIDQEMTDRFGKGQEDVLGACAEYFSAADAVIGHNICRFDLPLLWNTASRLNYGLPDRLAIDTMSDIPGVKGEKLITMCANAKDPKTGRDVGFTYDKHCALDDAKAVLRLISWHEIDGLIERAKSPWFVVLSHQDRSKAQNKAARKAGFRWNGDWKVWHKAVKEIDFAELKSSVPFDISITKDITLEQLRDD
jgi:DNA polymerase III epsilon subunit-like protein